MAFRFRMLFSREDAAGTGVGTAEPPAQEPAPTEASPSTPPAEIPIGAAPTLPFESVPAQQAQAKIEDSSTTSGAPIESIAGFGAAAATAAAPAITLKEEHGDPPPKPAQLASGETTDWALEETLASHKEWIESQGVLGRKADLAGKKLEGAELVGVNLRYAELQDANLKEADLLLADLRDACLVRTKLDEACLVGTNLEGANLESASLESAMGLVPQQLAGANLRDAAIPSQIREFPALESFTRASRTAVRLFGMTFSLSALSLLMIWKTKDVQLVTDSAILPFLKSQAAAAALPTVEIYLIAPALLLCLYLVVQYHLQRLWDSVLELPGVFPDGRALGEKGPWIVTGLLRLHFRWMNHDAPSTRLIEKSISVLLAYWLVPVTLIAYWARYLTAQEMHGTVLHVLLCVVATAAAIYSTTKVGRPQQVWVFEQSRLKRWLLSIRILTPGTATAALCVVLLILSLGTIAGVPRDTNRAPQYSAADIRRWIPTAFWSLGFDPYADITEATISAKPSDWSGADDQLSRVKGARLNGAQFRYAQAYGVFLANAHLWRTDFRGAFLSQADMRGADLGQANMRGAVLDRAQLTHANLDRANLDGAVLSRADLRGANLSYSSLQNSTLVDARLDGASLYSAKLAGATLIRVSLEKADLRDAHLDWANLEDADLQQGYFWSAKLGGAHLVNAQLGNAIFIDADLRGADLHGAQFQGTVLTGTNLQDANLDNADLRGALRLSAAQVCSTRSHVGTLMDDALLLQVEAQCGSTR